MTIQDALKSVQYLVDDEGHKTAVLLDIHAWELLTNWIESIVDTKIAVQALDELKQAGGRPEEAGWLAGRKSVKFGRTLQITYEQQVDQTIAWI